MRVWRRDPDILRPPLWGRRVASNTKSTDATDPGLLTRVGGVTSYSLVSFAIASVIPFGGKRSVNDSWCFGSTRVAATRGHRAAELTPPRLWARRLAALLQTP